MCLQATQSACLQQRNKTAYVGGRRTRSTVQMLRRVHASHLSPVLRQPRVSLAHPRPPTSRPPPLLVTCRQNSQLFLSFPGGSNHRPEFDERCLHRVTAHVHGQSLSGRTRPSQDKRLTVPEVESNPTSSVLTANPHYQTQHIATRLLSGTTDQIKPVVVTNLFSCPCRHLDSHLTVNPAVSRGINSLPRH